MNPAFHYIDQQLDLESLCESCSGCDVIALDTEFMRTNTYFPRPGLIQLGIRQSCYLIDPLQIEDWTCLKALLARDDVEFIIHSAGEDLNLLQTMFGLTPVRLFDTQVAAAFAGLGFSLGYQALVSKLFQIDLEKGATRSDWLKRPLSSRQLHYAAADVEYLAAIRDELYCLLKDNNRLEWFRSECLLLLDSSRGSESPAQWEKAYLSISNAWKLDSKGMRYLRKLALWREQEARRRNRPRYWLASDADLFNLANGLQASGVLSLQSITDCRHVSKHLLDRYQEKFLSLLAQCDEENDVPVPPSVPLAPAMRNKLKKLQSLVRSIAELLCIPPELLARKRQLVQMLEQYEQSGKLCWDGDMSGWRRELLESDFDDLLLK